MKIVMWVAIGMKIPKEFEGLPREELKTTLGAVMIDRLRQANFLDPEIQDDLEIYD